MKQIIKDKYREGRKLGFKGKALDEYVKTEPKAEPAEAPKKDGKKKK